ncbi:MAG: GNAT family protein [Reinekea sp.]|jgi:ribosomal-protein-serine acetyltransferase
MFKMKVDDEISLCLTSPKYAERMHYLVDVDRDYLSQWLDWPQYTRRPADHAMIATSHLKQYAEGKSMPCCIEYQGEIVGAAGFNTIEEALQRTQVGYWLASAYQGKGIMTRVCRKLIDVAFHELNLHKVQLAAGEGNMPSRAVAERLGMKVEGIITNAESVNDQIINHVIYGLHRSD